MCLVLFLFFVFKQKTAYEMRISDWSSDVCSSDLVGLLELSSFAKYEVEGPGARAWLDRMVANAIPKAVGRMSLAHALNPSGSVRSEFTITRMADGLRGERFYLVGPGAGHDYDLDFLRKSLPRDEIGRAHV